MTPLLLLLLACSGKPDPAPLDDTGGDPSLTGEGLFLQGCPEAGRATARVLQEVAEAPWGDDSLAAPGDVLLLSSKAAFVIQAPDDPRTYVHYGGMPIDAVAVEGCEQAGPERFGEIAFLAGQLDLGDFEQSGLHMIRGDSVQIISDGSDGGPAVVEVQGSDDRFWLVELSLIRGVFEGGGRKLLEPLYGLDITIRYTLHPDDAALQVEVILARRVNDGEPTTDGFLTGAVLFPSDHTPVHVWSSSSLSVGGIGLVTGVPWQGAGTDEGGVAVAMPGANMARSSISGVTALLDSGQALVPLSLADGPGVTEFLISVGPTDSASAAAALEPWHAEPAPGKETSWHELSGTVLDPSGQPVYGARVRLSTPASEESWPVLTELWTDGEGRFSGRAMAVDGLWRLQADADGRDAGEVLELSAEEGLDLELDVGSWGRVEVEAVDQEGQTLPVRVELEREDGLLLVDYPVPDSPTMHAPPGRYQAWVSRGYAYDIAQAEVVVPQDGAGTLSVELARLLDTAGQASMDSHVHTGPSPDSTIIPVDRMRSAAGGGLDLVISTDHEAIVDLASSVEDAGLSDWLAYGLGSEVTATIPEHTNAWPFPVREQGRGDPVRWYGLGFPGIYAAERERGARVVQLNHSRVNGECGILCLLDWDRLSLDPVATDPEGLGLPAGTEVWSWDFDSFELMNGLRSPYLLPDQERHSGALYDWLAFHNLGHRVAAVAVTDEHGWDPPGQPLTWVGLEGEVDAETMADGVLAGATVSSAGAFVRVEVDGAGPGQTAIAEGEAELWIQVQALPQVDVRWIDVLVNCDLWQRLEASDPDAVIKLDQRLSLPVEGDAYLVLVVRGEQPMPRGLLDYDASSVPRAVSSPIFIDGDGDGVWTAPGPKECDGVW